MQTKMLAGAVALFIAPSLVLAAPQGWSTLMTPQELSALIEANGDEVRVLQVNGEHAAGYIPGAVRAPYAEWRGPDENPGALPELAQFHAILERTGIEAETPVVVVHAGASPTDFGSAARVYWTLKSLGVEDLAILNGGLAGWKEAGLPVEVAEGGVFPSDWTPELSDEWRVTSGELAGLLERGEITNLVDARPPSFFEGFLAHEAAASHGTIPGSSNLTYEVWFEGSELVGAEEARRIAEETGQTDAPLTVSFCNTGHWAAINWFALSELAGVENTRLYAESVVEWSQNGGPMANVPNRFQFYWHQISTWFSGLLA
ncbi:rhodanese-like domain-containing protein [soil metagenome]